MRVTHGDKCGAAWSGTVVEHCPACHLTFGSTRAGDAHRVGDHGVQTGPNRRRCLTVDEMRAKAVKNGALAGQPFFDTRINRYGTEIWVVNHGEKSSWFIPRDDSPERTGAAGLPLPEAA